MEEILKQVVSVARGMWKYRWPAVLVAWVVAAAGVAVVFTIPDQYEARARIYVDTQSILKPLMSGLAVQPNVQQQVSMLSRTLISRPNIEKLIRMADLDLGARTKAQQEQLVTDLMKDLRISRAGRESDLYVLSYRHSDRDKAQRVIQSLVSIFVESSLGATRRDSASAMAFLDEQIKQYAQRLDEAELKLKEFRMRNIDRQLVAGGPDSLSRVNDLAAQLDQARLQLREAENARDAAKQQLEAAKSGAGRSSSGLVKRRDPLATVATPELDSRIDATKRNLDALLLRYTEQHPDVVAARRLIRDLEDQKAREIARLREEAEAAAAAVAAASEPGSPGIGGSPFEQQLNQMVASAEVQVATLRTRVSEIAARHATAVQQLRTSPAVEAELAQLNRDYAIHKKNYDDLVARRETAVMSGELETAGVAEFRLIDPPRVDPKPVAPNRLLLLPLALVAGLGAGLFLAFAASQLRPVFHDAHELRTKTQLPLIGIVSAVVSDASRRRQKMALVRFWSASGSLIVLFMAGMIMMALMAQQGS